ncbi:hypothetical protein FR943_22385 [Mycobacterium sp. TNTM28]|uniref:Uncharacterized protein n=1 Tax=[Mycobacterium] fortunisiensis TaxID=2600579 RepID=A0ABS6KSN1_9MYCO|nr:hypothetical protein [[Mycobacterium] fortunisiensis]MBU9766576.1 hypothetical protein [[Mycobacterium] fortunisiensis]
MPRFELLNGLSTAARVSLIAWCVLLLAAFGTQSWWLGLAGACALGVAGQAAYRARRPGDLEPWEWPEDFRTTAEGMTRAIAPTRERTYLPDTAQDDIAEIATTLDELQRLLAEKLPLWHLAAFTSVLLQRRNRVRSRLRACASGYQPGPAAPLDGPHYAWLAWHAMDTIAGLVHQLEQFMLSPAFTGALSMSAGDGGPDAESVVTLAHRLMDYHETLLVEAERCLQTPVDSSLIVFVQDVGSFAMIPLMGYDRFIRTMCDRVGQAQELLPFAGENALSLDDAKLTMELPDELIDQIMVHMERFKA